MLVGPSTALIRPEELERAPLSIEMEVTVCLVSGIPIQSNRAQAGKCDGRWSELDGSRFGNEPVKQLRKTLHRSEDSTGRWLSAHLL